MSNFLRTFLPTVFPSVSNFRRSSQLISNFFAKVQNISDIRKDFCNYIYQNRYFSCILVGVLAVFQSVFWSYLFGHLALFRSVIWPHSTPNFSVISLRTFLYFYSEDFYKFTPNFWKLSFERSEIRTHGRGVRCPIYTKKDIPEDV